MRDSFFKKAKEIHVDKYDYSKVNYKNSQSMVTIICPEHGEFVQRARNHIQGSGCPNCARDSRLNSIKLTTESFVNKAKKIHGDNKYDYANVNYKHSQSKVRIVCPHHGDFEQSPHNHLKGMGCIMCSRPNWLINPQIDGILPNDLIQILGRIKRKGFDLAIQKDTQTILATEKVNDYLSNSLESYEKDFSDLGWKLVWKQKQDDHYRNTGE